MSSHDASEGGYDSDLIEEVVDFDAPTQEGDLLVLTADHCRVVDTEGRVCGLLSSTCSRKGHKDPTAPRGDPGGYVSLGPLRSNSSTADGDVNQYYSLEDLEALELTRASAQKKENLEAAQQEAHQAPFFSSPLRDSLPDTQLTNKDKLGEPPVPAPKIAPKATNEENTGVILASLRKAATRGVQFLTQATQGNRT